MWIKCAVNRLSDLISVCSLFRHPIYLFADDTGTVHDYHLNDEPRHDAFLGEDDREDWLAFDDRQEGLRAILSLPFTI